MAWRTVGFSKQWKDNGTFWSQWLDDTIVFGHANITRTVCASVDSENNTRKLRIESDSTIWKIQGELRRFVRRPFVVK
jgi:hypothetical protein